MQCEKCAGIVFRRLPGEELAAITRWHRWSRRGPRPNEFLWYEHHKNTAELEKSKGSCGLCCKLWAAFSNFVDFQPSPESRAIYLLISPNGRPLHNQVETARCGYQLYAESYFTLDIHGKTST